VELCIFQETIQFKFGLCAPEAFCTTSREVAQQNDISQLPRSLSQAIKRRVHPDDGQIEIRGCRAEQVGNRREERSAVQGTLPQHLLPDFGDL
jgi:hypothetical protein